MDTVLIYEASGLDTDEVEKEEMQTLFDTMKMNTGYLEILNDSVMYM